MSDGGAANRKGGQPLEDILEILPRGAVDEKVRQRLRKFLRGLDELVWEDDGELRIDSKTYRRLLDDAEIFPSKVRERIDRETGARLEGKMKAKAAKGRQVRWRELAAHDNPLEPLSVAELRALGIDANAAPDDVKRAIRSAAPEFPVELLDASAEELRDIAVRGIEHNRTVWDCVVSKVGYWAALGIFAAFGALLIIGTATGPFGVPLVIFLSATLGLGTATIVGNCVLNPNF